MIEQLPLDFAAARAAKAEALERVDAHAAPTWKDDARRAVIATACALPEFTTDAIWARGLRPTRENRAIGPVMMWAARRGLVVDTGRTAPTAQVKSHASPIRVWRSLVYGLDPDSVARGLGA